MIGVFQLIITFMCSKIYIYVVSAKVSPLDDYRTRIVKGFQCSPLDYPFLIILLIGMAIYIYIISNLTHIKCQFLPPKKLFNENIYYMLWNKLVSVGMPRKSHFCGGSLLSKNLVLTAAHCCEDEEYFRVWAGLTKVRSVAQNAYVSEIYLHPNYSRDPLSTDLCVLKLASDIMENEYVRYVPIVNTTTWEEWLSIDNCRTAVAMGFGYQGIKWENGTPKHPNAPYSPMMQCVKLSILQPNICQLGLDRSMFCAIDPLSEGRDPCQGDSGGPLVCKGVQVGIISAGFGCGLEGYASIYTRVDLFSEYLSELILMKSDTTSISAVLYMLLSSIIPFIVSS